MTSTSFARAALLACSALTVFAAPGFAQTAPNPPAATVAEADADAGGIEDIVVTATKRETNLQKTPVAISVVNDQAIKDRHVQSLYDLADGGVPSLRIATFEARQSALTIGIRGIVPLDANQPAREQGVGIYVDGIYLARQHGLNAALFDVERIEVLKGPQGTLFGRNTEGGALNIVTKAPDGDFGGRATVGAANYNGYNGDAHVNLPLTSNLFVKVDGVVQHQDATTKDPLAGQTGWNYYHRYGGRAAVRWEPVDGLTDDFSFDYGKDKNTPFYSQLLNFNPNGCVAGTQAAVPACFLPGTAYTTLTGTVKPVLPGVVVEGNDRMKVADIGVPQRVSVDKTHGFTNILKWKAADAVELRALTAWRGVTATQWDNSGGAHRVPVVAPGCNGAATPNANPPAAACNFSRYSLADLYQDQFSQELQAVGTSGAFDYVAGLYYFNERVEDDAATPNSNAILGYTTAGQTAGTTIVVVDPCTGSAGFGSLYGCRSIDRASQVRSKSYAAYGQLTWNINDQLHLTGGGRYTEDKKEGRLIFSRNLAYGPVPAKIGALAKPGFATATPAQLAAAGYTPLDEKWHRFNPTATLAYDFSDTLHGYAKYASGYRAGGASSRTSNYQEFGPEDVDSYEVGFKSDFWDRRARFNLAAYTMDRKNSQVDISSIQSTSTGNFNNLVTINANGKTKIRGVEADLTLQPVERLQLTASYAYTYTRIPLVPITNTITVAGVTTTSAPVLQRFYIVYTPRNAASGAVDYQLPVGKADMAVRFHVDANYSDATQAFDQFATKNDKSFLVNGRISLTDIAFGGGESRFTLAVWGRNLFDEQHVFRRDPSNSLPGAPTTSFTAGSINNVLGDYGNFNAPRTYGIEASVRF